MSCDAPLCPPDSMWVRRPLFCDPNHYDSTIHCALSERHLISMTTSRDMIPCRRQIKIKFGSIRPLRAKGARALSLARSHTRGQMSVGTRAPRRNNINRLVGGKFGRESEMKEPHEPNEVTEDAGARARHKPNGRARGRTGGHRQHLSHALIHSEFTHWFAVEVPSLHVVVTSHQVSYVHPE